MKDKLCVAYRNEFVAQTIRQQIKGKRCPVPALKGLPCRICIQNAQEKTAVNKSIESVSLEHPRCKECTILLGEEHLGGGIKEDGLCELCREEA